VPFQIRYKFQEDKKYYTCTVTYNQFQEFSDLPIVKECEIVAESQEDFDKIDAEMQKAIDLVAKNDTSHIKKLSQSV